VLAFAALAFLVALGLAPNAGAAEPYEVPVILPLTGGGAFIGASAKANYEAIEDGIDQAGGIAGRPIHFHFYDDQTNPQFDVQLASQVIASQPAIILGSLIVGLCNAMAPLMRDGPVMYCLSPSFVPAKDGYTFSAGTATNDQVAAIIRYMRMKGWTRLGVLNGIDATGQNADKAIARALALPENQGVTIVENQRFNPTDLSVAAQIERIKNSGAQGMIAWTTGAPVATVFKAMIQAGLEIPVGTSSGNQTYAQMKQYADFLPKQLLIGSALFPEHDGIVILDPRVEQAQHDMGARLEAHDLKPDISTATVWDTALILVSGLRKLGPDATAAQLRDYIRDLKDFPGIDGIYDFKKYPDRGLGPDASTVVTWDVTGKRWVWLSQPGGAPLP
jgi:branched-chain amino acid transport system substrate-binding protein